MEGFSAYTKFLLVSPMQTKKVNNAFLELVIFETKKTVVKKMSGPTTLLQKIQNITSNEIKVKNKSNKTSIQWTPGNQID